MEIKALLLNSLVQDLHQARNLVHAEGKVGTNMILAMAAKIIIQHRRNVNVFAMDQVIVKRNDYKIQLVTGSHMIGQTFKVDIQKRQLRKSVYLLI